MKSEKKNCLLNQTADTVVAANTQINMRENSLIRTCILITVFTLNIGTPKLLTIQVLNFEQAHIHLKFVGRVANSVDPDQTPHFAASDLGLRRLLGPSVPILRVITVATVATDQTAQDRKFICVITVHSGRWPAGTHFSRV